MVSTLNKRTLIIRDLIEQQSLIKSVITVTRYSNNTEITDKQRSLYFPIILDLLTITGDKPTGFPNSQIKILKSGLEVDQILLLSIDVLNTGHMVGEIEIVLEAQRSILVYGSQLVTALSKLNSSFYQGRINYSQLALAKASLRDEPQYSNKNFIKYY